MVRTRKVPTLVLAVLSIVSAVACSGGERPSDDTVREISNEELAQTVLSLDQFGPDYIEFVSDTENGLLTMDQAAQEDDDPEAERVDLQQFGYLSGYRSFHSDTQFEGTGVYYVGEVIYLFANSDGATEYLTDSVDELGETTNDGDVSFNRFETFPLDVADQAIGARLEGAVERDDGSESPLWSAVAYFRHGRITGALAVVALEIDDSEKDRLEEELRALASLADDRIGEVLKAGA